CLVHEWTTVRIPFREKFRIPYSKLRHGSNPIVVQAYNQAGVREDNDRGRIERTESPRESRLRGLLVGISDYDLSSLELDYPAKDARALGAAWRKRKPGKLYTAIDEPKMLLDAQATAKNIVTALLDLQ